MKILSTSDMQAADQRTVDEHGVSFATLMESAGSAVARFILREMPHAQRIVIVCGRGNNGGDGLVAARKLAEADRQISVLLLGKRTR